MPHRPILCLSCLACLLSIALVSCGPPKVSDADITVIEESELTDLLRAHGDDVLLIDARSPQAFQQGHLPGAVNIPAWQIPDLDPQHSRLRAARKIIVYGNGWADPLSQVGTKHMMRLGFRNVSEFKGGMEMWQQAGHPVTETTTGPPARPDTAPAR